MDSKKHFNFIQNLLFYRMSSTQFQTAYTERRSATEGPPVLAFSNGDEGTRELYVLSAMSGLVAIVEPNKHLTMKIAPIYKRVNGALRHVLLNSSNTELAPCMAGPAMMEHFVTIASRREAPSFALKGEPLTVELFTDSGMAHSANMHLIALPRTMPCGYGKEWIEGSIQDPSVVDRFEAQYGL